MNMRSKAGVTCYLRNDHYYIITRIGFQRRDLHEVFYIYNRMIV